MAAGLAQLRELEKQNGWRRLETLGALFEKGLREILAAADKDYTLHRLGSMFCLFFREGPVTNLAEATSVDRDAFAAFFHAALERGVYFAPSPFETGFLSLAHGENEIQETLSVCAEALR